MHTCAFIFSLLYFMPTKLVWHLYYLYNTQTYAPVHDDRSTRNVLSVDVVFSWVGSLKALQAVSVCGSKVKRSMHRTLCATSFIFWDSEKSRSIKSGPLPPELNSKSAVFLMQRCCFFCSWKKTSLLERAKSNLLVFLSLPASKHRPKPSRKKTVQLIAALI